MGKKPKSHSLPFSPHTLMKLSVSTTPLRKGSAPNPYYSPIGKPSRKMVEKEMKEHPWASYRTAYRIAHDHLREKKRGRY
jgi:hypothetical protein